MPKARHPPDSHPRLREHAELTARASPALDRGAGVETSRLGRIGRSVGVVVVLGVVNSTAVPVRRVAGTAALEATQNEQTPGDCRHGLASMFFSGRAGHCAIRRGSRATSEVRAQGKAVGLPIFSCGAAGERARSLAQTRIPPATAAGDGPRELPSPWRSQATRATSDGPTDSLRRRLLHEADRGGHGARLRGKMRYERKSAPGMTPPTPSRETARIAPRWASIPARRT